MANASTDAREAHREPRTSAPHAIESAALIQPPACTLTRRDASVMGVRIPELSATAAPYGAHYGPAATAESFDESGAAFTGLLPRIVVCTQEAIAVASIGGAPEDHEVVSRVAEIVIPRIERDTRRSSKGSRQTNVTMLFVAARDSPRHEVSRKPFIISSILAPTDLSDSSIPALRHARFFADRFSARLAVLYSDTPFYPIDYVRSGVLHSPSNQAYGQRCLTITLHWDDPSYHRHS